MVIIIFIINVQNFALHPKVMLQKFLKSQSFSVLYIFFDENVMFVLNL